MLPSPRPRVLQPRALAPRVRFSVSTQYCSSARPEPRGATGRSVEAPPSARAPLRVDVCRQRVRPGSDAVTARISRRATAMQRVGRCSRIAPRRRYVILTRTAVPARPARRVSGAATLGCSRSARQTLPAGVSSMNARPPPCARRASSKVARFALLRVVRLPSLNARRTACCNCATSGRPDLLRSRAVHRPALAMHNSASVSSCRPRQQLRICRPRYSPPRVPSRCLTKARSALRLHESLARPPRYLALREMAAAPRRPATEKPRHHGRNLVTARTTRREAVTMRRAATTVAAGATTTEGAILVPTRAAMRMARMATGVDRVLPPALATPGLGVTGQLEPRLAATTATARTMATAVAMTTMATGTAVTLAVATAVAVAGAERNASSRGSVS